MKENVLLSGFCQIVVVLILVLLICRVCSAIQSFMRELNYINSEIERTKGAEKEKWLNAKKQHRSRFFIGSVRNVEVSLRGTT